jgi:hypothetical protein
MCCAHDGGRRQYDRNQFTDYLKDLLNVSSRCIRLTHLTRIISFLHRLTQRHRAFLVTDSTAIFTMIFFALWRNVHRYFGCRLYCVSAGSAHLHCSYGDHKNQSEEFTHVVRCENDIKLKR